MEVFRQALSLSLCLNKGSAVAFGVTVFHGIGWLRFLMDAMFTPDSGC